MAQKLYSSAIALLLFVFVLTTVSSAGNIGQTENSADGARTAANIQYLIEYAGDATYFRKAIEALGGTVIDSWAGIHVAHVSNLGEDEIAQLSAKTFVIRAARDITLHWVNAISDELNVRVQAAADNTSAALPSNAEFFDIQWGLQEIGMSSAWKITRGDRSVRVGILDTGISPDHLDLKGKYDLGASINFSASNPTDPKDFIDRHYHGTHISALIASNNLGIASVAPEVTLVGVKVLDDDGNADFSNLIAGIMYAVDFADVDIINLSLGGVGELNVYSDLAEMLHRAIDYAESRGVVVVASAGNAGTDLRGDMLRSFVTTDEAGTVLVSATAPRNEDGLETRACYSNYGDGLITLSAPGGSVDCTEESYVNMSDMVISALAPAVARRLGLRNPDGWYLFSSGTSMAAPIVTGVAALIKSQHPEMTPAQIVSKLNESAIDLGVPGRDGEFGYGLVNPALALR